VSADATRPQVTEEPQPPRPYDPVAAAEVILRWLDRWGWDAIPHAGIPQPDDPEALRLARDRAMDAAIVSGRADLLRLLQGSITNWALEQYRREAFGGIYLHQALEAPEQRREAINILVDAATANLLADILPEETVAVLGARFEVLFGGLPFATGPE
jgi:hypothetical protein